MKQKTRKWLKWQRGQALMEYWPTIPASIVIMLAASTLATFINGSFLQTVDYLQPSGLECPAYEPEEEREGPEHADLGCHSIELVASSYDEGNDRTTVGYKVTNACDPDISHWVLGLPEGIARKIVSANEPYEYVTDPRTGTTGVKFDREYGGRAASTEGYMLVSNPLRETEADSRIVLLTLGGHYDWNMTIVSIKAGREIYHSTITAPMTIHEGSEEECAAE